jgi:hypothetical protein
MSKVESEREDLLEQVETAMLRGQTRIVDIISTVKGIKTRVTAQRYMDLVYQRWNQRQTDNETTRQSLIREKREIIREAYTIIADSDRTLETVARFHVDKDAQQTVQQQLDQQEVIANGAYANKVKALATILSAQTGIAKLLGLEVKKVDVSGSIDILEQRESTIALLDASAQSHSIRHFLRSLHDPDQEGHQNLPAQRDAVALPSGESPGS